MGAYRTLTGREDKKTTRLNGWTTMPIAQLATNQPNSDWRITAQ
jgi:hypothetical protein